MSLVRETGEGLRAVTYLVVVTLCGVTLIPSRETTSDYARSAFVTLGTTLLNKVRRRLKCCELCACVFGGRSIGRE